jgi:hypothetical protein
MASSSSAGGSYFASAPPKASLTSVPQVFLLPSCFYFLMLLPCFAKVLLYLFFQELRSNLIIPIDDKPGLAFLGPMGDVDPTEIINFKTSRIPFKHASSDLVDWDNCFRSWTGYVKGWRDRYHRVSTKNRDTWEQYNISQCITLSLSKMSRNESLLIVASYF